MTTSAGVTVSDVIDAVRRKKALLAPETAGYLVLGAADQIAGQPALVDEHRCGVLVEAGRIVVKPSAPSSQADAERALRRLLQHLLDASNGSAPALSTVAGLPAKGNVTILISELESALIPVNRGAASRALSRLAREALRAREARIAAGAAVARAVPATADFAAPTEDAVLRESARDAEGELDFEVVSDDAYAESTAEDTEPISVGNLVADNLAAARESLESIDPDSISDEASFPHFPLEALRIEPAPPPPEPPQPAPVPEPPKFVEEAITARAPVIISEPPPTASAFDIDQLLQQTVPSDRPPPVIPDVPPPPPMPDIPIPPPLFGMPMVEEVEAPALPPSAPPPTRSSNAPSARGVDELLQDFMSTSSRTSDRVAQDLRNMTGVDASPARRFESSVPAPRPKPEEAPFQSVSTTADFYTSTPPPRVAGRSMPSLPDEDPLARRSTRRKVYVLFTLLALMTIGTVTVLRLKPGVLTGRTPEVIEAERQEAAAAAASIAARKAAGPCRAALVVTDVPQGAEVLVRSGIAPVDVDRLPSGARLEFVALTDGYAPRRGVVPQGVAWDTVNGKPRFELPIQLEKSRAKGGALDPWPAADPGSIVGGQGPPGSVHLVTSPKGAEVWMVAGGSPEAKIEALPCGAGMELLVAGSAQGQPFRRRLRVDASQLTPEPSANAATGRVSAAK